MPGLSTSSLQQLQTCDARLQAIIMEVSYHIELKVLEGHRGQDAQDKAFAEGKSKLRFPNGKHNAFPSRAIDVVPWYIDTKEHIVWRDIGAFGRLMGYIQRVAHEQGVKLRFGMDWDGDFRTAGIDPDEKFLDAPHVELAEL